MVGDVLVLEGRPVHLVAPRIQKHVARARHQVRKDVAYLLVVLLRLLVETGECFLEDIVGVIVLDAIQPFIMTRGQERDLIAGNKQGGLM